MIPKFERDLSRALQTDAVMRTRCSISLSYVYKGRDPNIILHKSESLKQSRNPAGESQRVYELSQNFINLSKITMGKANKALNTFIDNIPASKLHPLPTSAGTIYTDSDFRLDMQGVG